MKQVRRSQNRFSLRIVLHIRPEEKAIASQYLLVFRTPDNQLAVAALHGVELVDIGSFSRTSAVMTKSDFALTPDFAHDVRRVMCRHDINFVVRFIRSPQSFFRCQFFFQQGRFDRPDNFLHTFIFRSTDILPV